MKKYTITLVLMAVAYGLYKWLGFELTVLILLVGIQSDFLELNNRIK